MKMIDGKPEYKNGLVSVRVQLVSVTLICRLFQLLTLLLLCFLCVAPSGGVDASHSL